MGGFFLLLTRVSPFDTLHIRVVGPMAEWLGTGLQNLSRRFNSASDLREIQLCTGIDGENPV